MDRLWAKWQWLNRRFDVDDTSSYAPLGAAGEPRRHPGRPQLGRHDVAVEPGTGRAAAVDGPRRNDGALAADHRAPGPPTVGSMIDYQGVRTAASRLGFDYDDVPFEFPSN